MAKFCSKYSEKFLNLLINNKENILLNNMEFVISIRSCEYIYHILHESSVFTIF